MIKNENNTFCSQCNTPFRQHPYLIKSNKNNFCSIKCFKEHRCLVNPAHRIDVRNKMSISAKKRGRQSHQDGRTFKKYFCKDCNNSIGFHAALYGNSFCKKCAHKGDRNKNFGKTILIKFCKYNNIWFKSSWEANFAKWCNSSNIKWEYESKTFYLKLNNKKTSYIPDFYLPEFDCYIEIKGFWRKDSKEKVDKFIQLNPEINFKIFEKQDLLEYGVIKK